MAGVAPQHRGGSNATTIVMVVAIGVAVLLLGVLIWLFTQQESLRTTAENETRARTRLATPADEAAAKQMFPEASRAGQTVVGEMVKGAKSLSGRVTGNQNDAPSVALKQLDAVFEEIREGMPDPERVAAANGAAAVLRNLHQLFRDEQAAKEKARTDLAKAADDLEAMRQANDELNKTFKDQLAKMSAKVDELQKAKDDFERLKGDEVKALASQIEDKQDTLDTMRKDQSQLVDKVRKEIARRDKSIEEQSKALADLRAEGTAQAAEPLAIARKPIGRVLRALPGDALVHVNLGRQDNVALGMTFSVYSADRRLPPDGRGKATLEVVSLGDRTSECRIISPPSPDDPVLPGDGVNNIILSRNQARKTRICIVGQFDIDFDGLPDARGSEKIAALAKRYGAEIVARVDASTDYVVVGLPPSEDEEPAAEEETTDVKAPAEGEAEEDAAEEATEERTTSEAEEDAEDGEGAAAEDDDTDGENADDAEAADEGEADETGDDDEAADAEDDDENGEGENAAEDEADEEEPAAEETDDNADAAAVAPGITKPVEIDPTVAPRARRAVTEREKYYEAIRRAEMFSVPRLRQDQFFNFVGLESGADTMKRLME